MESSLGRPESPIYAVSDLVTCKVCNTFYFRARTSISPLDLQTNRLPLLSLYILGTHGYCRLHK